MGFFSSLSADHLQRYFRIIQEGLAVRRHSDLLRWLQGEIQHYLPHEIMVAAWGDFGADSTSLRHRLRPARGQDSLFGTGGSFTAAAGAL